MTNSYCKPIIYKDNQQAFPQERWGHSLVQVAPNQLAMYGGFGGSKSDGHYLDDLWSYNLKTSSWTQVQTDGQKPQPRSNYSFHYDKRNNDIVLFGGGSDSKCRFNSICILNWQNKIWRKIHPQQSSASPWERTYHSSEFVYPYLIVFGGESAHGIDLNDLWAFNIQTSEWKQLEMKKNSIKPIPRRFQTSAFFKGYFYVIGGCTGYNYQLLGDIYRVNLLTLIGQSIFQNYQWECVVSGQKCLQKWGHSTNLYNGKMYISLGRVNSSEDTYETVIFDPQTKQITKLHLDQSYKPKSRRRHASVIVGNSILIYGGYNGQYLQDFQYIKLERQIGLPKSKIQFMMCQTIQKMKTEIRNMEISIVKDLKIKLLLKQKIVAIIQTRKVDLVKNVFFKNMIKYSDNKDEIVIEIQKETDIINLKMINSALIYNKIPFYRKFNLEVLQQLLQSLQYFCQMDIIPIIENILIELVNQKNCLKMFMLAHQYKLMQLRHIAVQTYISSNYTTIEEQLLKGNETIYFSLSSLSSDILVSNLDFESLYSSFIAQVLKEYETVKFDLIQTKMREENTNFIFKATQKFKSLILRKQANLQPSIKDNGNQDLKRKQNIFIKFVKFVGRMCIKDDIEGQSQY